MLPTDAGDRIEAAARRMDDERWVPDPKVQAALESEVRRLNQSGEIEKAYQTSAYANERNEIVGRLAERSLARQFKGRCIAVKVDLPDHQPCRFYLRVGRNPNEVLHAPEASCDLNLDLMKPHDEWVLPPRTPAAPPSKPTPKPSARAMLRDRK